MRLLVVVGRAALHVGSEPADLDEDRLVRVGADPQRLVALGRLIEHLQGNLDGQLVRRHVLGQTRPALALL